MDLNSPLPSITADPQNSWWSLHLDGSQAKLMTCPLLTVTKLPPSWTMSTLRPAEARRLELAKKISLGPSPCRKVLSSAFTSRRFVLVHSSTADWRQGDTGPGLVWGNRVFQLNWNFVFSNIWVNIFKSFWTIISKAVLRYLIFSKVSPQAMSHDVRTLCCVCWPVWL